MMANRPPLSFRRPKPGFLIKGFSQPRLMGFLSPSVSWFPSLISAGCISLRLIQVWCPLLPMGAQLSLEDHVT